MKFLACVLPSLFLLSKAQFSDEEFAPGLEDAFSYDFAGFEDAFSSDEESDESSSKSTVAIVGAGIGGLTAAYNLGKLGYKVTVFEAEDRVGGKMNSVYFPEGGVPAWDFYSLDEEMEAKATELCGDERPTELGTLLTAGEDMKALAVEVGVPHGAFILDLDNIVVPLGNATARLTRPEYFGLQATLAAKPGETPEQVIGASIQAFLETVALFPEIASVRIDGSDPELALPTTEFAAAYNFSVLLEFIRPVLVGYGYGYPETVPAGIHLPFLYPIVLSAAGIAPLEVFGFPCGFQSLAQAMADGMDDVRLNAKVTSIQRENQRILVETGSGQPPESFDHLVISCTLDLVPGFLDVNPQERELFSKLSFHRMITTVANITSNDGELEIEYYADQGWLERKNHVNAVVNVNHSVANLAYQVVDSGVTLEKALDILDGDMEEYWQGSVEDVTTQKEWYNYFPTVSSQDFASGFYDDMEALQGVQNTYYVGGQMSFETTTMTELYARDLILRKFEPLDN